MFLLSKRKLSLRRFIYQSHTKVYMHNIDHKVYLCYNSKIDLVVNYFGGKPMKREEKNQQTQRRIMDSALAEFAEKGHGGSSVNTICAAQGISKGIIYHYFENKDELYLACVEECFQRPSQRCSAGGGRRLCGGPAGAVFYCPHDLFSGESGLSTHLLRSSHLSSRPAVRTDPSTSEGV